MFCSTAKNKGGSYDHSAHGIGTLSRSIGSRIVPNHLTLIKPCQAVSTTQASIPPHQHGCVVEGTPLSKTGSTLAANIVEAALAPGQTVRAAGAKTVPVR